MDALSRLAQTHENAAPPDPEELRPWDEDFDDFLDLFDELRGLVPLSFFLIFKIARVLKSPNGQLGDQLKGFYNICQRADRTTQIDDDQQTIAGEVPVFDTHNPHFGTRRIKGLEEISSVMPNDVAIEDFPDLMRKSEDRELNIRVLITEDEQKIDKQTAPIHDRGHREMSNAAEQKLYILLDRSYSMWEHHRLLFAKLLAIEYLRRKKASGARLFFRAFDFDVYELEKISRPADYDKLIRKLLYIEPGGKGTDIQLALLTAAEDIKFDGMLESAEILLISDGADHIDVDEVKKALGDDIKLHMIKLGRDAIEPSAAEVKEMKSKDHSMQVMDRDQIASYYKKQLMLVWDEVTETMIETDDLDSMEMAVGEEEVQFALDAAEKVLAVEADNLNTAQTESAFRKASFVEGFLGYLSERIDQSPAAAARKGDIENTLAALHAFKLRIAQKNQMLANLLAGKDLKFVNDRELRKAAKKANMTLEDLARLSESPDLWLKLKLGARGAPSSEGGGISLWLLLKLVAKSAGKAATRWFFPGEKEEAEAPEEPAEPEKPTEE